MCLNIWLERNPSKPVTRANHRPAQAKVNHEPPRVLRSELRPPGTGSWVSSRVAGKIRSGTRGCGPGRRISERAQKTSESACSVAVGARRTTAGAGLRGPLTPGSAAGMAASLWMGDVSEHGRLGRTRRNLGVTREEGSGELFRVTQKGDPKK